MIQKKCEIIEYEWKTDDNGFIMQGIALSTKEDFIKKLKKGVKLIYFREKYN